MELTKQSYISLFHPNESIADAESRQKAIEFIENNSFPTLKTEEWRHTNITPILQHEYTIAERLELPETFISSHYIPDLEANIIVLVNGYFSSAKILPSENSVKLIAQSMKDAKQNFPEHFPTFFEHTEIYKKNIFSAFNSAFATDGLFLFVPSNTVIDKPIHILNFTDNTQHEKITMPRNLILIGENSQAQIIETFHSVSETADSFHNFNNLTAEIILASNSILNYQIVQNESAKTFRINNTKVIQFDGSTFNCNTFTLNGNIVRNELKVNFWGQHAQANLNGLYLPSHTQIFDNFTHITHLTPNCNSQQTYRGIVNHKATGVFLGKVFVAKDAQKTNAYQSNKNIVLSNDALVNSKPQLEIYADDVKCSHGSTTGQLDTEALFYMQARGISKDLARNLLLKAFSADIVEKINIEPLKKIVYEQIDKSLNFVPV